MVLSRFIRAARHRWPRLVQVTAVRDGDRVRVRITSPAAGPVPEREHTRMVVHLADTLPAGPWCPPVPASGGTDAPDTYRLPGTPVQLGGVFDTVHRPRLEADGGSASLRLDLAPDAGPFSRCVLPAVTLDALLRTSVLDGSRPDGVPVMVPTALAGVELYTAANDAELADSWGDGVTLRHWRDPASGESRCAAVAPSGQALIRAVGVTGADQGVYDTRTRTWRTGHPADDAVSGPRRATRPGAEPPGTAVPPSEREM